MENNENTPVNENQENQNTQNENQETPKNQENQEFVPKKSYEEVRSDMHKYKSELKKIQAQLSQREADDKAREKAALEEKQEWEKLYKAEKEEKEKILQAKNQSETKVQQTIKKAAVIQALGGFKNPTYASFIDTEAIKLDENGNVDSETLQAEVDRVRQTHPELLKSFKSSDLPNSEAPDANQSEKKWEEMTKAEQKAAYRKMIEESNKKLK